MKEKRIIMISSHKRMHINFKRSLLGYTPNDVMDKINKYQEEIQEYEKHNQRLQEEITEQRLLLKVVETLGPKKYYY